MAESLDSPSHLSKLWLGKVGDKSGMKKRSFLFGAIWVALIVIAIVYTRNVNTPPEVRSTAAADSTNERVKKGSQPEFSPTYETKRRSKKPEKEEVESLKRELDITRAKFDKITRPLQQDVLSSTVNAQIKPGETLVTGGYRRDDGNYELTFVTPRSVTLEDGREAIEISSKIISVGAGFVASQGLDSIATNARNTLQHGESWMQDDVQKTLTAAAGTDGVRLMSSPKVTIFPSAPFTLNLMEEDGTEFSIEGTATKQPDGSFAIQTRVERTLVAEQN